jgi:hypothetical protein
MPSNHYLLQLAQSQEYPEWFQRRYAVLIVRLEHINQQLEPSLLHLHAARTSPVAGQAQFQTFSELSSPYKGIARITSQSDIK